MEDISPVVNGIKLQFSNILWIPPDPLHTTTYKHILRFLALGIMGTAIFLSTPRFLRLVRPPITTFPQPTACWGRQDRSVSLFGFSEDFGVEDVFVPAG